MEQDIKQAALQYHAQAPAGKIAIAASKPMQTQRDLALAYSPGVAIPCLEISKNAAAAATYTTRANLVAVITNGTAVLGLGDIGPLASKPVMEGKAVLFKKFADINSIDIEVAAKDPQRFIDTVVALEPTFGGINLEDIKAPDCFIIEQALRQKMQIPVFHDDQHGTAIIAAAGLINAIELCGKKITTLKVLVSGAGAAAIACLNLLQGLGLKRENILIFDAKGMVHRGRTDIDQYKLQYASDLPAMQFAEAFKDRDFFLGLSAGGIVSKDMIQQMADQPIIFALANPDPEILPEDVKAVRDDAIIATGRSDYPNQINNVLCFPFLFRGALDVEATSINEAMKLAAVHALASLTRKEESESLASAYRGEQFEFNSNYIIPKPFDNRLILEVAPAVAKAAMESGVAKNPIKDWEAYRQKLSEFVFRSSLVMRPIYATARTKPKRVVFAEGEEPRVLRAAQTIVDEQVARVTLIGRRSVIQARLKRHAHRLRFNQDFEVIDPENDPRYRQYWQGYHKIMGRHGASPGIARNVIRTKTSVIGAMALELGDADAMICGVVDEYISHFKDIEKIIGLDNDCTMHAALCMLVMEQRTIFLCDTHLHEHEQPEDIAHMAWLACRRVASFGIQPKVAFISRSNFGGYDSPSTVKMRKASEIFRNQHPKIIADGEMHSDSALDANIRELLLPDSKLTGEANILVFSNLDAANSTYNAVKILAKGQLIGPLLLGARHNAHIVTNTVTARGLFNLAAIASADGIIAAQGSKS